MGAFGLKSFKSHRILWDDIDLHDDDDNEAIGYLIKKIKPVIFSLNDIEANEKSARIEAYRKIWGFKAFRFIGLPQGARTLRTELRSNRYPYKLPQKLQKLREMAKGRSFSDYLEAFLEDKENIKIIRNKEKKIIGLEYNKEEFLSVKSNNEIISESRAKSNIERKTTKVALNKPRSVDLTNEVSENTETVKPQHNVTISRENILLDAREELKAKEFIEDEKLLQFIQVSNNYAEQRRTTETVVSHKYESEREVVRNKHIFQIFSLPFIDIAVNKVTTYTKNLASSVIKQFGRVIKGRVY